MYNSQIVRDLLEERGLKIRDLLDRIGGPANGSFKQAFDLDIRASKLEKLSDFFGVPIDTFFDRTKNNDGPSINVSGNRRSRISVSQEVDAEGSLRALLSEKDKRIAVLEEMISLLKSSKPNE